MTFHVPSTYRVKTGRMASSEAHGNNGAFVIANPKAAHPFNVIASEGLGWEHVSVSMPDRCPTWAEMCYIKNLFWDPGDAVMQLHPPADDYVNNHEFCLHLWRPMGQQIPLPPAFMVGYKGLDPKQARLLARSQQP